MVHLLKFLGFFAAGLVVSLCLGCGGTSSELDIVPAGGTVKLDGQPLPDAIVTFYPERQGLPATGSTDANGQFTLTTKEPGDGALVGKHKIAVRDKPPASSADDVITTEDEYTAKPVAKSKIPNAYTKADQSGLTEEVKPGENDFLLDLKSN